MLRRKLKFRVLTCSELKDNGRVGSWTSSPKSCAQKHCLLVHSRKERAGCPLPRVYFCLSPTLGSWALSISEAGPTPPVVLRFGSIGAL